jgi:serine/threonine kinase PknH
MCIPLRIFISYSHSDQTLANELVYDLRALGHEVWCDAKLAGGQEWWDVILERLRWADVVTFVASNSACRSAACMQEFAYARALNGHVLPVLIDDALDVLPESVRALQQVDYRGDDRKTLRALAQTLSDFGSTLSRPRVLPEPLPPEPPAPYPQISKIRDRLAATSLTLAEQNQLLDEIQSCLQGRYQWGEAVVLLQLLRQRDDVARAVSVRLEDLLRSQPAPSSETKSRAPWVKLVMVWVVGWIVGIICKNSGENRQGLATALAIGIGVVGTLAVLAVQRWGTRAPRAHVRATS